MTFLRMNEMKGFNPILFIVQVLLSRSDGRRSSRTRGERAERYSSNLAEMSGPYALRRRGKKMKGVGGWGVGCTDGAQVNTEQGACPRVTTGWARWLRAPVRCEKQVSVSWGPTLH